MGRLNSIGFELNSLTAGIEVDGTTGAGLTVSSTTVRSGAGAGRVTGISAGVRSAFIVNLQTAGTANYYARFYLRLAALPSATTGIFDWVTGLGVHFGITCDTSGRLALQGGSVGGTPSAALALNTWYRVEIHFDNSTGVGTHTLELRLDGAVVESSTNNTLGNIATLQFGANTRGGSETASSIDAFFDDFALNDTVGATQNSWPGAGSLVYLFPSAAGDSAQFTIAGSVPAATNWQSVAEHPPDDGVTFVTRTTTGAKVDDHKVGSPATAGIGAPDPITLVHVTGRVGSGNATATAGRRALTRIKSAASGTVHKSAGAGVQATAAGGTAVIPVNVNGWATHLVVSVGAGQFPQLVSYVDPTTGVAWTRDGTNSLSNMQIGVEPEVSSTNAVNISALWAIVEFVPPVQIAASDSATATDSLSSSAATSDSDTGSASDTESITAQLSEDDPAAGTEALSVAAAVTDDEPGTASDTAALQVQLSDADSASSTDDLTVAAAVADDDTGAASDDLAIAAALSDSESAAGDELAAVAAATSDSEVGEAVDDLFTAAGISDSDLALIAEGLAVVVQVSASDSAAAADDASKTSSSPGSGWLVGAVRL